MTRSLVIRLFFYLAAILCAAPQVVFAEQPGSASDYAYPDSSGATDTSWGYEPPADSAAWDYSTADYSTTWVEPIPADSPAMADASTSWDEPDLSGLAGVPEEPPAWSDPAFSDTASTDLAIPGDDPALSAGGAMAEPATAWDEPASPGFEDPGDFYASPDYAAAPAEPVDSTPPFYATPPIDTAPADIPPADIPPADTAPVGEDPGDFYATPDHIAALPEPIDSTPPFYAAPPIDTAPADIPPADTEPVGEDPGDFYATPNDTAALPEPIDSTPPFYAIPPIDTAPTDTAPVGEAPGDFYATPDHIAAPPEPIDSTPPFYATPVPTPAEPDYATPPFYATPAPTATPPVDEDPRFYATPSPTSMPPEDPTNPALPSATPPPYPTPPVYPTPTATPAPTPPAYGGYPPAGSPTPPPNEPVGYCGDGICEGLEPASCQADCEPQGGAPQSCPGELEHKPPASCSLLRADLIEPFDFHRQSNPETALWQSSAVASGAPSRHGTQIVPLFLLDDQPIALRHEFLLPHASDQYQRNSYLLDAAIEVTQPVETAIELVWLDAEGFELDRWHGSTEAHLGVHSYRASLVAPCGAQSASLVITAALAADAAPAFIRLNHARFEYLSCSVGDPDDDGLFGEYDNCPLRRNVDQFDRNADGVGDACSQLALTTEEIEQELAKLPSIPGTGLPPQSQPAPEDGSETGGDDNAPVSPSLPPSPWELFPKLPDDDEIYGSCGMHNVCQQNDRCCLAVKAQLAARKLAKTEDDIIELIEATARECPSLALRGGVPSEGKLFMLLLPQDRNQYGEYLRKSVLTFSVSTHSKNDQDCLAGVDTFSGYTCKDPVIVDPCVRLHNYYALEFVRMNGETAIFERPERDGGPSLRAKVHLASCDASTQREPGRPNYMHCDGEIQLISNKYRIALKQHSAALTERDVATFRIYTRKDFLLNAKAGVTWPITEPIPELGYRSCNNFNVAHTTIHPAGVMPANIDQRKLRLVVDTFLSDTAPFPNSLTKETRTYTGGTKPPGVAARFLVPESPYEEGLCEPFYSGKEFYLSPQSVSIKVIDGLPLGFDARYEFHDPETDALVKLRLRHDANNSLIAADFGKYFETENLDHLGKISWAGELGVLPSPPSGSSVYRYGRQCLGQLRTLTWQ